MRKTSRLLIIALFIVPLLKAELAWAAGPVHGAKETGMGTAFVAVADDPSAIAANIAGLCRSKGTNIYGGGTAIIMDTTYENQAGQKEETEFQIFYPPHFFASFDLGREDIVMGIGLYSPFGIGGRKWSETGLTRYAATESSIGTYNINPAIAWQVSPSLAIGGGVYYMYASNRAERMIDQSALGAGDGKMVIDADGKAWGFNLGVLLDINDKLSLGLAYRSRATVNFHGQTALSNIAPPLQPLFGGTEFNTETETAITFPDIISLGIAYKLTERLTLDIDGELVRWSSLEDTDIRFENQVPAAGFTNTTVVYDWKDSRQIKIGMDYRVTDVFSLRTGYAYVATQVPEHTLSPASPESDQHNFGIGAGWRRLGLTTDIFYMIGLVTDRKVENNILSGTYKNTNHYFGLSIGKHF